jgi:hypothetical protein
MGAAKFTLIEKCLAGLDVAGKVSVIEVGTEHQGRGDGSTRYLHAYCASHGIDFYTCDIDPIVASWGKQLTPNAVCSRGEDFITGFMGKPIAFAYLDNFDWCYPGVENVPKVLAQAARYRDVHGIERTNVNSQLAHLKQAEALLSKLHSTAFILFDDTHLGTNGLYEGKGGTAVPFMLSHGMRLIEQGDATHPYVLLHLG